MPCLELSTPDVNTSTNFTFGVEATVNGYKYSKKIKLQIIDNPTPSIVTTAGYFLYSVAGLNIVLSTSMVLFNSASSSAIWMMVNIYQMMLLLPLIGAYIHPYVVDFIKGFDFAILSCSLPYNEDQNFKFSILSYFNCEQSSSYLGDIGLQSWSTIVNISSSLSVDAWIIVFHFLIFLLYLCIKTKQNWIAILITKLLTSLTFSVYIRKFLETFMLFTISSASELYSAQLHSTPKIISFWSSAILTILLALFPAIIFGLHSKSMETSQSSKMNMVAELFDSFKRNRISKLYFFVFTVRRLVLVWWIILGDSLPKMVRICVFCLLQIPSLPYLIIWRPYDRAKENLWEILNELTYSSICIFLIFKNSKSDWSSTLAYAVIILILMSSIIILMISIFSSLNTFLKPCTSKCKK